MKVESRAPGVRLVAMEAVGENQAHLPFPAVSISPPVSDQISILVYHSRIPQCMRQDYEVAYFVVKYVHRAMIIRSKTEFVGLG